MKSIKTIMAEIEEQRKKLSGVKPLSKRTITAMNQILLADYLLDKLEGDHESAALTHLFFIHLNSPGYHGARAQIGAR